MKQFLQTLWDWLNKGLEKSVKDVVFDNHIDTIHRNITYYVDELHQALQEIEVALTSQGYVNGQDFFINSKQLSISPQLWEQLIYFAPYLVVKYLQSLGALDGIGGEPAQWKTSSIYMETYERWADYIVTLKTLRRG